MMNCKCEICQGNLERGIKSAIKDNGDYYIACPDCGMVYLVHTLENGLTKLERTPEDSDSEEIKEQIKEAYDLFAAAGKDVVSCISKIHNEKENIRDIINDEEDYDDDCDDDVDMDNLSYIIIKKNGIIPLIILLVELLLMLAIQLVKIIKMFCLLEMLAMIYLENF